jgi:hypothetical protein
VTRATQRAYSGDLAELAAHLDDHAARRPSHGKHAQRSEQERHDAAEEEADDDDAVGK